MDKNIEFLRFDVSNFGKYSEGFYHKRNLLLLKMLESYNFQTVFEFAGAEGDLAELILTNRPVKLYVLTDLLPEAVEYSKERLKRFDVTKCEVLNMEKTQVKEKFDLYISTALEHASNDVEIIRNLPKGALVVLSLPSFPDIDHYIYFENSDAVKKRYGRYLEFLDESIIFDLEPRERLTWKIKMLAWKYHVYPFLIPIIYLRVLIKNKQKPHLQIFPSRKFNFVCRRT